MEEIKRVVFRQQWIIVAILLLVGNLCLYMQQQADTLGVPLYHYDACRDAWRDRLSGLADPGDWLAQTQAQRKEYAAWDAACFLAEDPGEIDPYYLEKYPDIQKKIQAVQAGRFPGVSPEARAALQRWEEQLTERAEYTAEIDRIVEQAEQIQSNPLFAKKGSFAYRNAGKTAADYLAIKNDLTGLYITDTETSVIGYQANILFHIGFLFYTVIRMLQPLANGVEPLLRTTANGRRPLALARVVILLLSAVTCVVASVGGQLLLGSILYRQAPNWSLPAQCVSALQNWTVPATVGGFFAWFCAVQIGGVFVVGLCLWLVLSHVRAPQRGIFLLALCFLGEYVLFRAYEINDAGYWLSSYNIFHLLSVQTIAQRYLNYNVLGFPVGERTAVLVLLLLLAVALSLLTILPRRGEGKLAPGRLAGLTKLFAHRKRRRLLSSAGYEWKKLCLLSAGAVFLLAGLILLWKNEPDPIVKGQREALYTDYVDRYAGSVSEGGLGAISAERESAEADYLQIRQGQADERLLAYHEARCWALSALERRYQELLSLADEGIENVCLVNEDPYDRIYGEHGGPFRERSAAIVLAVFCLTVPLLFSIETRSGIKPLLFTTVGGRKQLWRRKMAIAFWLLLATSLIWSLYDAYLCRSIGGSSGLLAANAAGFSWYSPGQSQCAVIWYILRFGAERFFILLAATAVIWLVSAFFEQYLTALGISAALLFAPALLDKLGISILGPVSCIAWLAKSAHSVPLYGFLLIGAGCLASALVSGYISTRRWRGTGHICFD